MYLKLLGLTGIIILLSNCATMNKADCLNADWQLIGFEDGSLGKNEVSISQHRKDCSEHGVTPDLTAYRKGHYEGAKAFCTTHNGFTRGLQGKEYKRNCPEAFEKAFLTGFSDGQNLYGLKKVLNQRTDDLEDTYKELDWLEHTIAEKSEVMISDGLNRNQRIAIRDEIAEHQTQQQHLYAVLRELKQEFENASLAYEQAKREFANYSPTN
ncbi:DUF2799 domain-containing protein [uncultured Paraglaciecola sp.]|uniref:DUF2799 domain-containing protein n=1 Tax=uncultured Paraglaciecola sp. TaxID=1765024 RepID=UPI0030D70920|tara:strand:+ start:13728 stop:14360 length:633 start_codon:yes stop_codon:yes gene_type:complete